MKSLTNILSESLNEAVKYNEKFIENLFNSISTQDLRNCITALHKAGAKIDYENLDKKTWNKLTDSEKDAAFGIVAIYQLLH